jgi:hypothetical protein
MRGKLMGRIRTLGFRKLSVICAFALAVSVGFLGGSGDGEAHAGMSSSALTGVMYAWEDPAEPVISYKVIDSTNGNIVWQSAPSDMMVVVVVVVDYGVLLIVSIEVDEAFRPDGPIFEWVMVTNAVRANSGVWWTQFVFNDIFDVNHWAPDVPGFSNI